MFVRFYQLFETLKNSPAKRNKGLLTVTGVAVVVNLAIWIFLYFMLNQIIAQNPESTTIPLHYNVFLGIDFYGKWWMAYGMPLIGLVTIIINLLISLSVYSKKELASYFLTYTSLLVQIALAGSAFLLIFSLI